MDLTTQRNLFTNYPTAVDIGATIVSGLLLTLSSVSWINDPISKTGVVFATLLNTTILGLGNKLGKTDKSVSPLYRNAITVVSLTAGSFAAPNVVPYLPQEFEIILSYNSALYIAGFTLVAKVTIYVLYTLSVVVSNYFSKGQPNQPDDTSNSPKPQGNQKPNPLDPPKPEGQETPDQKPMPSFPSEVKKIAEFTKEELTHFHKQFQEKDGQRPFELRYQTFKIAFLNAFERNGIQIGVKDYQLTFKEISESEFVTYKEILWKYVRFADITQLDRERLQIFRGLIRYSKSDWDACPEKEKISYITQFLKNNISTVTFMDSFIGTTYWSQFGDVSKLDQKRADLICTFFLSNNPGKEKWRTLPLSSQLHVLDLLDKKKLYSVLSILVCDLSKLTEADCKAYHHLIWEIALKKEANVLFEMFFSLSLPSEKFNFWKLDKNLLEQYLVSVIGAQIKVANLSKNQLKWLQEIGKYTRTQSIFDKFSEETQKELVEKLTKDLGSSAFKFKQKGVFATNFRDEGDSPAKFPLPTKVEEFAEYDEPKLIEFYKFFFETDEGPLAWENLPHLFKVLFSTLFIKRNIVNIIEWEQTVERHARELGNCKPYTVGSESYKKVKEKIIAKSKPHEILGCSAKPTSNELTKSYRKLVLYVHPDRIPAEFKEEADCIFKCFTDANEFLKNFIEENKAPK